MGVIKGSDPSLRATGERYDLWKEAEGAIRITFVSTTSTCRDKGGARKGVSWKRLGKTPQPFPFYPEEETFCGGTRQGR